MPLITGLRSCTHAGLSANIKAEIKAGKPREQAQAIAFDICRRAKEQARKQGKKVGKTEIVPRKKK